jgi:hypothetical protein
MSILWKIVRFEWVNWSCFFLLLLLLVFVLFHLLPSFSFGRRHRHPDLCSFSFSPFLFFMSNNVLDEKRTVFNAVPCNNVTQNASRHGKHQQRKFSMSNAIRNQQQVYKNICTEKKYVEKKRRKKQKDIFVVLIDITRNKGIRRTIYSRVQK